LIDQKVKPFFGRAELPVLIDHFAHEWVFGDVPADVEKGGAALLALSL
jgi:hypothetical protein